MVPFLHITTRIPGHPYDGLLGEKGGTGFPTLMFLDAKGNQLLKHRGPRSVGGFEASLEQVEEFQALTRKAEAGDAKAAAELFVRQLQLGWFELDAARKRYSELKKVSSKQKKAIEQLLIDLEVRSLAEEAGDDLAARVKAGAAFQAMWKDKRIPEGASERYSFWTILADYAWEERDKSLFKKVVTQFEKTMSMGSSYNKKTLKALEARLKGFPK